MLLEAQHSDTLELELQVLWIVNHSVGAEN